MLHSWHTTNVSSICYNFYELICFTITSCGTQCISLSEMCHISLTFQLSQGKFQTRKREEKKKKKRKEEFCKHTNVLIGMNGLLVDSHMNTELSGNEAQHFRYVVNVMLT